MKKVQKKRKSRKLYQSISTMLCGLILLIFIWLIASSAIMAQRGISAATFNGLEITAKANGCQIQEYMNICQSTAKALVSQIEEAFAEQTQSNSTITTQLSEVYGDLNLNSIKKELEGYLIGTAKNAVANNQAVIGIGIMFEPYQFTDERESYALYFTEEGGKIAVSDVGAYSEFSVNNYYQIALDKTDTVFTEPYTYRDMWMLTGATPIRINGTLVGVINVDVSMDVFNSLSLTNELYPSISTKIISTAGTVDYDSELPDNIGKNYIDVEFKNTADYNSLNSQLQSGKNFYSSYVDKEGKSVYSFFTL